MKDIPSGSVDCILADVPYGTTACKWDSVIPFEPMWEQLNRIIKPNGAICLFGSEPFSSALRMSNIKNFKYDWYWQKTKPSGHLNAKKQPLRKIENISVFYEKQCTYNPQGLIFGSFDNNRPSRKNKEKGEYTFGIEKDFGISEATNYPNNVLSYSNGNNKNVHPTQKPISLLEYLIKTYTNEGEMVLDFTMGSGSTGVACINTNRRFIGIELDEVYFNIAKQRIDEAIKGGANG
jgi:site-specific DNA-methyltransferase (adenine-specific)